jgi:putative glutamine amidotransferase
MSPSRPRIGITTSTAGSHSPTTERYAAAVRAAGGEPVWLPPAAGLAERLLDDIDALLLSGGKDIDPQLFGERVVPDAHVEIDAPRDAAELSLARVALQSHCPILGICRGIQTLNVAAGGTLHQDLGLAAFDTAVHQQRGSGKADWEPAHPIAIAAGSRLAALLHGRRAEVNSFHHQAVKAVASGFVVTATAPDGVIEALEDPHRPFVLAVQWHPERMVDHHAEQRRLFAALIDAARQRRALAHQS